MRSIAMFGALAVFAAAPLAAQGKFRTGGIDPTQRQPSSTGSVLGDILGTQRDTARHRRNSDHIPPGQMPPAGMCRIWIDGVPPGRQPAPTDCQTAVATRPANARVIWGDQTAFPGKGKGSVNKGKSGKHHDADEDRDDDGDDEQVDRGRERGDREDGDRDRVDNRGRERDRDRVENRDRERHRDRVENRDRERERDRESGWRSSLAKRGKKG